MMPTWLQGIAAAGTGVLLVGCAAQREPLAIIQPNYTFHRHPLPLANGAAPSDAAPLELAAEQHGMNYRLVEADRPALPLP